MSTNTVVPFRGTAKNDGNECGDILETLRLCRVTLAHTDAELSHAIAVAEGTRSLHERRCGERLRAATEELRKKLL